MKSTVDPADSLRVLANALAPYMAEVLGLTNRATEDDWLDVAEALPSCKHALYRACRTAALPGRRIKRRWLVRRKDLDAWVESHETGSAPVPPAPKLPAVRELTPAEQLDKDVTDLMKKMGMRRLTDEELAAKGLPPHDINRAYEESLAREREREEKRLAAERADNDPKIAAQRAAATRAADEARAGRPVKLPRVRCNRCGREASRRKDGLPVAHECPHRYGRRCRAAGDDDESSVPRCPWCAKERAEGVSI